MAKPKEQRRQEAEYRQYVGIARRAKQLIDDYGHRIRINREIEEDPYCKRELLFVPLNVKEVVNELWDKHDAAEEKAEELLVQLKAKYPRYYP